MWGNLVFLGLGASALCFVTWNMAVKELGPVKTSLYIYLVPALTVLASAAVLGDPLTPPVVAGVLLTIAGLFLSEFARGSKAQRKLPFRIVPDRRREAVGLRPLIPAKLAAFFRIRYVFSITRLTGCTEMLGTGRLRAKGSTEHRSSNGKHARMFHVKHLCVAMPRDVGSVAAPASKLSPAQRSGRAVSRTAPRSSSGS